MLMWRSFASFASSNIELFETISDLKADSKEAKFAIELENLFKNASCNFTKKKQFDDMLLAMFTIGIAVADCDNEISPDEKRDIEGFLAILEESQVSTKTKRTIKNFYKKPPKFEDAIKYVRNVDRKNWQIFDIVIDWIVKSDNKISEEETKFKIVWNDFKQKNLPFAHKKQ